MNKTIKNLVSFVCLITIVMSMVIVSVSADSLPLDASVNLITSADASQDKLDITVNPDSTDEWITIAITNEDGRLIELIQEKVGLTNNFTYSLLGVESGKSLFVKISTAPSNKVKDYTKKYYSFAEQQQAMDDIMNPSLEITQAIADKISLELDGDFSLINGAGIGFMKEQLAIQFEGQETIDVQTFIDALNEKICISILSSKDAAIIKSYMEREITELGIATLTEYTWYNELGSDSEKVEKVISQLATGTYTTVTTFVDAFKAENFLNKLSKEHSSTIISFISTQTPNQSNNGSPVNLDWVAYGNLQPGQKEYFAGLVAGIRYTSLSDFESQFASKLTTASLYVEQQPADPGTTPGITPGTTPGITPGITPGTSLGTISGGVSGGTAGGATPPSSTPGSSGTFKDLSNVSWATEAIDALYKKGVINGVGGEKFDPEGIVTKEQFVKIIAGTFDIKATGEVKAFSDVPAGQWYTEFINAAVENGIVNGVSESDFGLGTNISRQDMAVIVYRVANKYGINLAAVRNDEPADIGGVSDYAKEAVSALYKAGIINGVGEGRFAPADIATRAQAAKIIYELWRMM